MATSPSTVAGSGSARDAIHARTPPATPPAVAPVPMGPTAFRRV